LRNLDDALDSSRALDTEIPDQRLGLMFACAHPAIDASIRAPLMLQTVLGVDAATIASAFLVSSTTMGKRLVRAKEKIRRAGISFSIPERDELEGRLDCVLDAIYAAYSEGWNDPVGTEAARRELAEEAMFLGSIMVELAFDEPEALGLLALMLYTEARRDARRGHNGDYVPLDEQDASRWDVSKIAAAENLVKRAGELRAPGRYQLEAALQSAHVHRRTTGQSNWKDIVVLYDALHQLSDSPVIAINRAIAIAEIDGAHNALDALPDAAIEPRLLEYQPYWAARASLLARTGAIDDARRAYDIASGLEHDPAVRKFLQRRKDELAH
jgi:predicted RNA polymerase sigma factor